jgi:hypothetical protein
VLGESQADICSFVGSSRDYADAMALTDPVALVVDGRGVDLAVVVLDAARDGDQPTGRAGLAPLWLAVRGF